MRKLWAGLFCVNLFLLIGCAPNKINRDDCKCEDQPEAKTEIEEKTQECNIVEVKEIDKDSSLDRDRRAVICRAVGFFVFGG